MADKIVKGGIMDILTIISLAAQKYFISSSLLIAICTAESNLTPNAFARHDGGVARHSYGVCQVQYTTATMLGFKQSKACEQGKSTCALFNPSINAEYAAKYLRSLLDTLDQAEYRAVSAYNAGRPVSSNQAYVRKVLKIRASLTQ